MQRNPFAPKGADMRSAEALERIADALESLVAIQRAAVAVGVPGEQRPSFLTTPLRVKLLERAIKG